MESPSLKYIKELSEGDEAFENNILNVLKNEFPQELDTFKENFKNKNYKEASINVHKIKHKISILGFKKGLDMASCFENDLKKGDIKLYNDFINILDKIHVYLNDK